ncbi:MAG: hypothetical protein ACLGJB_15860 [Blastocatellia bacterium]
MNKGPISKKLLLVDTRIIPLNISEARPHSGGVARSRFSSQAFIEKATNESWSKQKHSYLAYFHKWWARRLKTTCQAMIDLALTNIQTTSSLRRPTIWDPFMGAGSIVEAALEKGCNVIAGDINPVPFYSVTSALDTWTDEELRLAWSRVKEYARKRLNGLWEYAREGQLRDLRYALWATLFNCPACEKPYPLLNRCILTQHAYPETHHSVHVICPYCKGISKKHYKSAFVRCVDCNKRIDHHNGTLSKGVATCPYCQTEVEAARYRCQFRDRFTDEVIGVAFKDNPQELFPPTPEDSKAAHPASSLSRIVAITAGETTRQLLAWGYTDWAELFTPRQRRVMDILTSAILKESDPTIRNALCLLLSAAVDFNCKLCSFKGFGTGLVRHATPYHVLQKSAVSLENNPFGGPRDSGTYDSIVARILQARARSSNGQPAVSGPKRRLTVYLGSSVSPGIADSSLDAVVTDPPYCNTIYYQDLSELFCAVLTVCRKKKALTGPLPKIDRLHSIEQNHIDIFQERLTEIWKVAYQKLKPNGKLVFSFHHPDCHVWSAICQSLINSKFKVLWVGLAKAEPAQSLSKAQANMPTDKDVILECSKIPAGIKPRPKRISVKALSRQVRQELTHNKLPAADLNQITFAKVCRRFTELNFDNRDISTDFEETVSLVFQDEPHE